MLGRGVPIPSPMIRVGVAVIALVLVSAASADAAASPWAVKANAVCKVWQQKAAAEFGPNPAEPSTPAAMYRFMQKARPIEAGELNGLKAIRLPRPAGAARALTFAAADLAELDQGLAAYRAGNQTKFLERVIAWQTDHRATRAFKALGAPACT